MGKLTPSKIIILAIVVWFVVRAWLRVREGAKVVGAVTDAVLSPVNAVATAAKILVQPEKIKPAVETVGTAAKAIIQATPTYVASATLWGWVRDKVIATGQKLKGIAEQ